MGNMRMLANNQNGGFMNKVRNGYFIGPWDAEAKKDLADAFRAEGFIEVLPKTDPELTDDEWVIMANCGDIDVSLEHKSANFLFITSHDWSITGIMLLDRREASLCIQREDDEPAFYWNEANSLLAGSVLCKHLTGQSLSEYFAYEKTIPATNYEALERVCEGIPELLFDGKARMNFSFAFHSEDMIIDVIIDKTRLAVTRYVDHF